MAVKDRKTAYDIAEVIEVQSEGATAVDLMRIPAGTVIENVIVRIKTPATGSVNLTVGDDDDADGYIVAASAVAAAGTVYGEDVQARGVYLYNATYRGGQVKLYQVEGKELKLALSGAPTTEGVYQVLVYGKRYAI